MQQDAKDTQRAVSYLNICVNKPAGTTSSGHTIFLCHKTSVSTRGSPVTIRPADESRHWSDQPRSPRRWTASARRPGGQRWTWLFSYLLLCRIRVPRWLCRFDDSDEWSFRRDNRKKPYATVTATCSRKQTRRRFTWKPATSDVSVPRSESWGRRSIDLEAHLRIISLAFAVRQTTGAHRDLAARLQSPGDHWEKTSGGRHVMRMMHSNGTRLVVRRHSKNSPRITIRLERSILFTLLYFHALTYRLFISPGAELHHVKNARIRANKRSARRGFPFPGPGARTAGGERYWRSRELTPLVISYAPLLFRQRASLPRAAHSLASLLTLSDDSTYN